MAALPQPLQHQLRAQIQAEHIRTQLRNQSQLNKQQASTSAAVNPLNMTPGLPQRSPSPENRGIRRSPTRSSESFIDAKANGSFLGNPFGQTTSAASTSGVQNIPTHIRGLTPPALPSSGHRQTPTRSTSALQSSSNHSRDRSGHAASANRLQESATRRSQLLAEQKKHARETKANEVSASKRIRLEAAPGSDYQGVLAPDYKSPFTGQVSAWLGLLPYHVLLDEEDSITSEEWDVGISALCEKYRGQYLDIRKKLSEFSESTPDFSVDDVPGLGSGLLSNGDSVVMEIVLLEDMNETAMREKAVADKRAREIAQRRSLELQASRKAEEQTARAAEAARQAAMQTDTGKSMGASSGRMPLMGSMGVGVMYGQGVPGNSVTSGVLQMTGGGSQSFGAGTFGSGVMRNNLGMHGQVEAKVGNYDTSAKAVAGIGRDEHTYGEVGGEGASQVDAGGGVNFGQMSGQSSSGLSMAFENARQAAMGQGRGLEYEMRGQYGTQAVSVNNTGIMSQSWPGRSMGGVDVGRGEAMMGVGEGSRKGMDGMRSQNVVNGKSGDVDMSQGDGYGLSKIGIGASGGQQAQMSGNGKAEAGGNGMGGNRSHLGSQAPSDGNGQSTADVETSSGDKCGRGTQGVRRPGMMSLPGGRGLGSGHAARGKYGGGKEDGGMGMGSLLNAEGR
ncbi:unnamed protein product [Chondrus crispus]|uniref:GLTSCR protein conserved domain-containing protein n=1 Tax=Chondrus crispus TaxID=2769 RepID=R7QM52_CHOCR|nr:unnamed protein product [Chondrus crispus]CDF39577.1 unnamed protein product [Chondrus crispus]|eukprot:XP_005709871.1 unnamed protein product [Chondrus crispus]